VTLSDRTAAISCCCDTFPKNSGDFMLLSHFPKEQRPFHPAVCCPVLSAPTITSCCATFQKNSGDFMLLFVVLF
jgi:hypothetical protein